MNNSFESKFPFFFEYNIHKSTIPIGIVDSDYERLAATYGVSLEILLEKVADISESNNRNAKHLLNLIDGVNVGKLENKRVVFLGDSNTSCRKSYMNIIRTALANLPGFETLDWSVSGGKVGNLIYNMYPNIHSLHSDIAHIMIGSNDIRRTDAPFHLILTTPEIFFKSLDFIVTGLIEDGTKVILTSLPPFSLEKALESQKGWRSDFWEKDRLAFNDVIQQVAAKHKVVFNDMDKYFSQYAPEEVTIQDGIHLNELGHQILAEQVLKRLAAL